MEEQRKISVLMSVYHKEKPEYLDEAVASITNQTYKPDEIVVVKDGPLTDDLEAVLCRWVESYPHLFSIISLEKNMGLGEALAIGVEACKNEWIARMDTDDIAALRRFEKQMKYINTHPDIALIGTDIIEFEDKIEQMVTKRVVPHTYEEILAFAKRRNPFNHMTVLYKKKAVLLAGNYQPLNGYEDYYLWVRMLKMGMPAYNIPEVLVYARGGKAMYERRGGWKYFKDGWKAQKKIYSVGLAGPKDFIVRMFGQVLINLVPSKCRGFLYKSILRKGKND